MAAQISRSAALAPVCYVGGAMVDGLEWIGQIDLAHLRQLVGTRGVENALGSTLAYVHPPIAVNGAVRAVLGNENRPFVLALRAVGDDGVIAGQCSQCASDRAPCAHATVLAVDLACSAPLRDALAEGADTREIAARLPESRRAAELERRFDGALRAWLGSRAQTVAIEIAASPEGDAEKQAGRAYGDHAAPKGATPLALYVRRAGAGLLAPRDALLALAGDDFAPRDRAPLAYARERGSRRRALYAVGVEASLTIEAMRAHGGIFAPGFKTLLDFRDAVVRPALAFEEGREGDFDAIRACFVSDDGATRIDFDASIFFDGPFPYVWAKSGAIYRLAPDVDRDLVRPLAEAPTLLVPRARRKEAGARLLRAMRGRGIVLPAAEAFGLSHVDGARFALRLTGEPLDLTGELVAIYGEGEVSLFGSPARRGLDEARDLAIEARAREAIARAGLVSDGRVAAEDDAAIAFWREGIDALRASEDPPIAVTLSERLAKVRLGAPIAARIHVTLEGNWLATRLAFAADELAVELDDIRAALARKQRWVALADGVLARISASIEGLVTASASIMDSGAFARLPAHQLGRLDRWIDENDGRVDASVDALRRRLRALAVAAEPTMPEGLVAELRPYQRLGLAWLQFLHALGAGGILADDMGLGKTITTLAFLLHRREADGPHASLVVCPASVATNWVREAQRFTPDLRVLLVQGGARLPKREVIDQHDLVVTTYALLRRDVDALAAIPFRCAILDEAQNVKNAEGATRAAAGRLQGAMRLALSGTPIENRLSELWSLMSFANPGILGTARAFETYFERPIAADPASPLAAELRAIVRPFLLRRTKNDVLRELPPKTEIDRVVTLAPPERRMYDALAHTLRASLARNIERRDRRVSSLSVFTALMRLRQMACDPRLVDPLATEPRGAKRETFLALVRELVAEGRRALVFSQFVSLLTLWREDLDAESIPYEYLDGSTDTALREAIVLRFQSGAAPLFLLSLKAGGAGLNLTAADTVIHCDPWWNPAVEDQASDRAYRIGQEKPVTVVRLVARGTIEEKLLSLKERKRALTSAVIGDDARALDGINEDDVRLLLGDVELDAEPPAFGDVLATRELANSPDFSALVARVRRWMAETGRSESELANALELPLPIASRLARGEPFPCSRATAERILERLRAW